MQKKAQMLDNLQVGQEVVMISGLHGVVDEVNKSEDLVVLNCEGIYLTFELNAVAKVVPSTTSDRTSVDELTPQSDSEVENEPDMEDKEISEENIES